MAIGKGQGGIAYEPSRSIRHATVCYTFKIEHRIRANESNAWRKSLSYCSVGHPPGRYVAMPSLRTPRPCDLSGKWSERKRSRVESGPYKRWS